MGTIGSSGPAIERTVRATTEGPHGPDQMDHAVRAQPHAGDRLLVAVASRLTDALRAGDTVARVGGDEFVVLLDEVATPEAAMFVAERLGEVLQAPYELGGDPRTVTVSIGVAIGPESFGTADEIIAAADSAMYEAKRRGRGLSVLYRKGLPGLPS